MRVLEGLTAAPRLQPRSAFAKRLQCFLPHSEEILLRLYDLRSHVKHMNDFSALPEIWKGEDLTIDEAIDKAQDLMSWVEVASCQLMIGFLQHRDLKRRFDLTGDLRNFSEPNIAAKLWKYPVDPEHLWATWRQEQDMFSELSLSTVSS